MDQNKTVWWMVLWGIVRHVLGIVGAWLAARQLIDADTHTRLMSEGAAQLVGWVLMLVPIAWSVMQKTQVWGWVRKALALNRDTPPDSVPSLAPGPSVAI